MKFFLNDRKEDDMTIIGMPASSFFAFLSWPFVFIILAVIVYNVMAKQDAKIDDSEFDQSVKGRSGNAKKEGGADK